MKVFISVDIEGVAGVVDPIQGNVLAGGGEWERARRLMTDEANAAIVGAIAGGASEIVVNDSHSAFMRNIIPEQLNQKARLIQGRVKQMFMVEGLDASFDAVMLVGYHAPAGVRDGVLNHAFHPYELRYNGKVWSETGLSASVAGHYGVPVVLVTGDEAAIRDANRILGYNHVSLPVKRGISRMAADSLHPAEACVHIQEAAMRALQQIDQCPPLELERPITVEMDFYFSHQADLTCLIPTIERVGDRTVRYRSADAVEAYRTFLATTYISRVADQ